MMNEAACLGIFSGGTFRSDSGDSSPLFLEELGFKVTLLLELLLSSNLTVVSVTKPGNDFFVILRPLKETFRGGTFSTSLPEL